MSIYAPLTDATRLPTVGAILPETETFDIKGPPSDEALKDRQELAKDVAAFANRLGGTILIGAYEAAKTLGRYAPIPRDRATAIVDAYAIAVKEFCSPRPEVIPHVLASGDGFVVAINVPPYIAQPVGVRHRDTGLRDSAWRFPMRSGADTIYLDAENLAHHMVPSVRRTLVILSKIAPETPFILLHRGEHGRLRGEHAQPYRWVRVNEDGNVAILHRGSPGDASSHRYVSLDVIVSVYDRGPIGWAILVDEG